MARPRSMDPVELTRRMFLATVAAGAAAAASHWAPDGTRRRIVPRTVVRAGRIAPGPSDRAAARAS